MLIRPAILLLLVFGLIGLSYAQRRRSGRKRTTTENPALEGDYDLSSPELGDLKPDLQEEIRPPKKPEPPVPETAVDTSPPKRQDQQNAENSDSATKDKDINKKNDPRSQLFIPRASRRPRPTAPRGDNRPKPTLPSFIRNPAGRRKPLTNPPSVEHTPKSTITITTAKPNRGVTNNRRHDKQTTSAPETASSEGSNGQKRFGQTPSRRTKPRTNGFKNTT